MELKKEKQASRNGKIMKMVENEFLKLREK